MSFTGQLGRKFLDSSAFSLALIIYQCHLCPKSTPKARNPDKGS